MGKKLLIFLKLVMKDPPGAIIVQISPLGKYLMPGHYGTNSIFHRGNKYILVAVDYLSKWVEAKALPTNDARVVVKFLKSLFARFGTPRAIISDRGTHFCNDKFAKVMSKYGVTHRLATAYHTAQDEWSSGGGVKSQTPIGCTPYKLVYGKSCHLPIELEHRAYWALKHANFDLKTAGDHRKLQLNELNELRDQAYENSLIYKEKTKKLQSRLKDKKTAFSMLLSCLLKEQLLEPALNLTVHCCGLEFRFLNDYDQKSFDEERGLNCVVQTSIESLRNGA
ncbi:reverse transcriptase domain-containing protein [Tanacetum coccineum]